MFNFRRVLVAAATTCMLAFPVSGVVAADTSMPAECSSISVPPPLSDYISVLCEDLPQASVSLVKIASALDRVQAFMMDAQNVVPDELPLSEAEVDILNTALNTMYFYIQIYDAQGDLNNTEFAQKVVLLMMQARLINEEVSPTATAIDAAMAANFDAMTQVLEDFAVRLGA